MKLDQLKSDIAELVEQQRLLKPQRKTVNLQVNRTVDSGYAISTVAQNKFRLRHLYIVYGLLRGKTLDQIEPSRTTQPSDWWIEKFKYKYTPVETPQTV